MDRSITKTDILNTSGAFKAESTLETEGCGEGGLGGSDTTDVGGVAGVVVPLRPKRDKDAKGLSLEDGVRGEPALLAAFPRGGSGGGMVGIARWGHGRLAE